MKLSLEETPAQELARLRLEYDHLDQQCRTAHQMGQDWRERALKAETALERLQRKYDRLRAKYELPQVKKVKPIDPADQALAWEMEAVQDAPTEVQV